MQINRTLCTGIILISAACFTLTSAQPQPMPVQATDSLRGTIESLRADLRTGKVKTYNQVMKLTEVEAAAFWPIYHDYEEELFALGDDRLALIKDYLKSHATGNLTNEKAKELTEASFKFQSDRLDLMKKYEAIVRKETSALRAAEFVQIENRFSLVIDLMIASEVPLVSEAAGKQKAAGKD